MKLCFWLMSLIATRSSLSAAPSLVSFEEPDSDIGGEGSLSIQQEQDFECDPSCGTCRGSFAWPFWCLTCADDSPVTIVHPDNFGFCGEPCPICYDGLAPTESNNTYWSGWPHTGNNCSDDIAQTLVLLPANREECSWVHKLTYLQCGCPTLPPLPQNDTAERCPICADGSDPSNPNATVLFRGYANTTCNRLADAFAYPRVAALSLDDHIVTKGSFECSLQQYAYHKECGCPEPEVHEDACTICYDGSPVASEFAENPYTEPYQQENYTCAEKEASLAWSGYGKDDFGCRYINGIAARDCGCNPVPTSAPTPDPISSASVGSVYKITATVCVAALLMYWS